MVAVPDVLGRARVTEIQNMGRTGPEQEGPVEYQLLNV